MKTTFDLPPDLLRKAKIVAVQRNTTLKALVEDGLQRVVEEPGAAYDPRARNLRLLEALDEIRLAGPVEPLDRDAIHDRGEGQWP